MEGKPCLLKLYVCETTVKKLSAVFRKFKSDYSNDFIRKNFGCSKLMKGINLSARHFQSIGKIKLRIIRFHSRIIKKKKIVEKKPILSYRKMFFLKNLTPMYFLFFSFIIGIFFFFF